LLHDYSYPLSQVFPGLFHNSKLNVNGVAIFRPPGISSTKDFKRKRLLMCFIINKAGDVSPALFYPEFPKVEI